MMLVACPLSRAFIVLAVHLTMWNPRAFLVRSETFTTDRAGLSLVAWVSAGACGETESTALVLRERE